MAIAVAAPVIEGNRDQDYGIKALVETASHYSARNEPVDMIVPITHVQQGTLNPRVRFEEGPLQELAQSIQQHGLLQPIVVRPVKVYVPGGALYEIVAGERRWRACGIAGLTAIPVRILEELTDEETLRLAIVENVQRQDLDPIEEAAGYRRLAELGMKQSEIAAQVQKSQPAIANRLRLLKLPEDVQERIRKGELTAAHGVALASFEEFPQFARALASYAIKNSWTTKQLENPFKSGGNLGGAMYDLDRAGVIKDLSYEPPFDAKICHQCPFGAYRKAPYGQGYCLKPEHYKELVKEGEEAKNAAIREAREEAGAKGQTVPRLSDLDNRSFQVLSNRRLPSGCAADCSHRQQAVTHKAELVEICTNPGCLEALYKADRDANQARCQEEYESLVQRLTGRLDGIREVGSRDLAFIAALALRGQWEQPVKEAYQRHVGEREIDFSSLSDYSECRGDYEALGDLSPVQIVQIVVEAAIRRALRSDLAQGSTSKRDKLVDWYLGDEPSVSKPAQIEPEISEAATSLDPTQSRCGLSATHAIRHDAGTAFSCEYHIGVFQMFLDNPGEPEPLGNGQTGKIKCGHLYAPQPARPTAEVSG